MSLQAALVLLAFALLVTLAPWRRRSWHRPRAGLVLEGVALAVAVAAAHLLGRERAAHPMANAVLLGAAYWYALAGGVGIVDLVLRLVPVTEQREAEGIAISGVELGRGRIIGVLERALALTLILGGQFGALGLVLAAKALARFRGLEERDFAEYFLIGTLASLLVALTVGVGVRLLLP